MCMWKGVGAGRGGAGVCREGGGAVFCPVIHDYEQLSKGPGEREGGVSRA